MSARLVVEIVGITPGVRSCGAVRFGSQSLYVRFISDRGAPLSESVVLSRTLRPAPTDAVIDFLSADVAQAGFPESDQQRSSGGVVPRTVGFALKDRSDPL